MVTFPNCKINLGLNILQKREDGYHNLETVFYPVQLKDALEIIESKKGQQTKQNISCSLSGIPIEGDTNSNLCVKAYNLLQKDFPDLPVIKIHLHKVIPLGAGLGGGSADGAFTLKLLNDKFKIGLTEGQLLNYALQLGSDCPFFIINKPCFATGKGEKLEPLDIDLSAYKLLIVFPGIHINTAWAFSNLNLSALTRSIKEIIKQPVKSWKENLANDFETPVFLKYPEINKIKNDLYMAGAIYASMSGSGSVVYGIFKKEDPIRISFPGHYFVKELIC